MVLVCVMYVQMNAKERLTDMLRQPSLQRSREDAQSLTNRLDELLDTPMSIKEFSDGIEQCAKAARSLWCDLDHLERQINTPPKPKGWDNV